MPLILLGIILFLFQKRKEQENDLSASKAQAILKTQLVDSKTESSETKALELCDCTSLKPGTIGPTTQPVQTPITIP